MGSAPSTVPAWLLADLHPLLRLATTLAGSTPGAAELAAQALATDTSWRDADSGYDLTPRLRAAVVRTFLASPLGRSRPPAGATGLDALTGSTRTAVVLRDGEQLTTAEIAAIMDRPGRRVADELAAIPAGSLDAEIADLAATAPTPDEVGGRFADTSRHLRRRRRTRRALLAAVGLVVVAAVVVPTMIIPRLPHDVRPVGQWRFSHELRLPAGWHLRSRTITADTEQTTVSLPWPDRDLIDCTVTVTAPGSAPYGGNSTRPTTVNGRPGVLVEAAGSYQALAWQYADDAWAAVECPSVPATEALLRDIAGTVRFTDNRQLLPFDLTALPDRYRITMVGSVDESPNWGPFVVLEPPDNSDSPVLLLGPDTDTGEPTASVARCLDADDTVCVTASQSDDQVPMNIGLQRYVLSQIIASMRLASDPNDRSTWFDAIDLPAS